MNNHFKFSETQANREELQKYREDSNSVLSFVKECCEISSDGEVSRTELFNRYKEYCTDAGLAPFAQRNFNAELENNYPSVHKATDKLGKRRTWRGLHFCEYED